MAAASVPPYAIGPALITVGALMMMNVVRIKWEQAAEALPAFITIILMPMTYSIAYGEAPARPPPYAPCMCKGIRVSIQINSPQLSLQGQVGGSFVMYGRMLAGCGGRSTCMLIGGLPEALVDHAGIIGGLLSYIIINGANFLLDKVAECMQWSISGSETQPPLAGSGSFISRLQSNTGGAAQVQCSLKSSPSPHWSSWCMSMLQDCLCDPASSRGSRRRPGGRCSKHVEHQTWALVRVKLVGRPDFVLS